MQVLRKKQFRRSYSDIAWWLAPLVVFIGGALLLFGTADDKDPAQPLVLERPSSNTELVVLGSFSGMPTPVASGHHSDFIPPDELLRQSLLEKLHRFRTEFRQMAPAVRVVAAPGSTNRDLVKSALEEVFATVELAPGAETPAAKPLVTAGAGALFYTREANREIAYRLLTAISPYFRGRVLVIFDDSYALDRLLLVIRGTPRFDSDGAVVLVSEQAAVAVE